jgi:hypothetical protein
MRRRSLLILSLPESLQDKSRAPHRVANKLTPENEDLILSLGQIQFIDGKVEDAYSDAEIARMAAAKGLKINPSTVGRVIRRRLLRYYSTS